MSGSVLDEESSSSSLFASCPLGGVESFSVVSYDHPILDLVATVDDAYGFGLKANTQRLTDGIRWTCLLIGIILLCNFGFCLGSDEDKKLFARMLGDGELTVHVSGNDTKGEVGNIFDRFQRIAGGQAMNSLRGVKWWFDRHEADPEYNVSIFFISIIRASASVVRM